MVKLLVKSVVLSACVLGLVGCGSGMPSCDDKEVKDLITQIVKNHLTSRGLPKEQVDKLSISYSGFMTNATDEGAKKVTCKAEAKLSFEGRTETEFVEYTAQHTSDGKVYVEVKQ